MSLAQSSLASIRYFNCSQTDSALSPRNSNYLCPQKNILSSLTSLSFITFSITDATILHIAWVFWVPSYPYFYHGTNWCLWLLISSLLLKPILSSPYPRLLPYPHPHHLPLAYWSILLVSLQKASSNPSSLTAATFKYKSDHVSYPLDWDPLMIFPGATVQIQTPAISTQSRSQRGSSTSSQL